MSKLGVRINTTNAAASQYIGMDFDSLVVFNGVVIGAGSSGIFKLEGESDNGVNIEADFKTFSTDLGVANKKRMRNIVLSGEFEGSLEVLPVVDNDEGEVHSVPAEASRFHREYTVPVNRDNQGAAVGVRVKNTNGSYFCVESIDVLPVILGVR